MTNSDAMNAKEIGSDPITDFRYFFRTSEEQPEPHYTTLKGMIPDWVDGILIRTGPGKFDLGDFTMNHWFDGYAILYNFIIQNGQVTYRSRFLRSDAHQRAVAATRPVLTEFGTRAYPDPNQNLFSRLFNRFVPTDYTDNGSINVYLISNEVYCATESCHVRHINPKNIETLQKVDLNKIVGLHMSCSHPQIAPDGTAYVMGSSFLSGLKYHLVKVPPSNSKDVPIDDDEPRAYRDATVVSNIPCRWKTCLSYFHSFGLSQNYIILVEQPLLANTLKVATINVKGRSLRDCIEWRPEEKTRFIVVDRHTGKTSKVTYMTDGFFMLHHINMYEEEGHIVCDMLSYKGIDIVDKWFLSCLRTNDFHSADLPRAQRFVLPTDSLAEGPEGSNLVTLKNTTATAERQPDGSIYLTPEYISEFGGFELPQINNEYRGIKYNYAYGSGCFMKGHFQNSVGKLNIQTKKAILFRHCNHCYPGEPIFVPRPGATEEDDGVILTVAVDVRPEAPDILFVLDARTMTELGRAVVPVKVPALMHGTFVPAHVSRMM